MISLPAQTKNDRLSAISNKIDEGASELNPAHLTIFSGIMPENHAPVEPENLALIDMPIQYPSAQSVENGILTLKQLDQAMAIQTGLATWCRIYNGNNEIVFDADVGNMDSDAFLRMANTQIYEGIYLTLEETYIAE